MVSAERLAAMIEDYIATRPRACDSAPGIADWWLPEEYSGVAIETLQVALDLLCERGVLEEINSAAGSRMYRPKQPTVH